MNANKLRANELRIGNWYHEFGIAKQVTPDTILGLYQIELAGKIAIDVTPITLTDELLVKLGFKKSESKGVVGFDYSEPDKMTFWYEKGKFIIVQFGESTPFIYPNKWSSIEIKSAHQLQNLYFALTGEELICQL